MVFCATIQYAIMVVNNIGHTITASISMRCVKNFKLGLITHCFGALANSAAVLLDFGCFVGHDMVVCLALALAFL